MAGAGPSPAGGVGGAAREINPSDAALLYQTVVAAQFLEDAQLNGRLADREYNVEAKKLWQQWHQIVGAKKMSPGELAEFRRANGLDEWTDLGWSMLHRPSPRTAMGGSANDSYKISQLTSALESNRARVDQILAEAWDRIVDETGAHVELMIDEDAVPAMEPPAAPRPVELGPFGESVDEVAP